MKIHARLRFVAIGFATLFLCMAADPWSDLKLITGGIASCCFAVVAFVPSGKETES